MRTEHSIIFILFCHFSMDAKVSEKGLQPQNWRRIKKKSDCTRAASANLELCMLTH